jgi:hypothetical protein
MGDADARPQGPSQVSRRTLIAGAAWAVPTVAVLSATPAFAASSGLTKPAVTFAYAPNLGVAAGTINLWSAQIWYNASAWQIADFPSIAHVEWRVVVKDSTGAVVATLVANRSKNLAPWANDTVSTGSVHVPAGTYTVVAEIISVTFSPATVKTVTFHNQSLSASTTVVVP